MPKTKVTGEFLTNRVMTPESGINSTGHAKQGKVVSEFGLIGPKRGSAPTDLLRALIIWAPTT
jgi:hypothetical protein